MENWRADALFIFSSLNFQFFIYTCLLINIEWMNWLIVKDHLLYSSEAEIPLLWSPNVKKWLIGKRPWFWERLREKEGGNEDDMVGWHHRLSGHEFEQTLGDSEGQGSLAWCSSWGCKESDRTEWLNWTELNCSSQVLVCEWTIQNPP